MLNARLARDYFFYFIKAKTRHGTHSPFVYRLVDEVIYDHHAKKVYAEVENKLSATRRQIKLARLVYRLAADLDPRTIIAYGTVPAIISAYLQKAAERGAVHDLENEVADKIDVAYFASDIDAQTVLEHFSRCLPKVHGDSMLIFTDIYKSEEMKAAWAQIKANPKVTATVDMFRLGLVFFRPGQAKEDFWIRI